MQSLYDEDLKMMNRKHSASESLEAIEAVKKYFSNFSIDLIYGLPHLTAEKWEASIEKILSYEPPHISAYALTVEPQTAWDHFVKIKQYPPIDDKQASQHFYKLSERLKKSNYQHYEISNFSLPNYESKHNTSYWNGLPYIGVGPSAHSYNGSKRRWNINKNPLYIKKINEGIQYYEEETLTKNDRFNELIMTGLRTLSGVSLAELKSEVSDQIFSKFLIQVSETEGLYIEDNRLKLQPSFWFLSDGIAANLFCV